MLQNDRFIRDSQFKINNTKMKTQKEKMLCAQLDNEIECLEKELADLTVELEAKSNTMTSDDKHKEFLIESLRLQMPCSFFDWNSVDLWRRLGLPSLQAKQKITV